MQLALKYILSLFIICSRACHSRFLSKKVVGSVYDYSKNSTDINRLKISETTPVS